MRHAVLLLLLVCKGAESPQAVDVPPSDPRTWSCCAQPDGDTPPAIASAAADAGPRGLTAEQIRQVVVAHQGSLRHCYETRVATNPALRGGIRLSWNIAPSGLVTDAAVVRETLGDPELSDCVVRLVRTWRFPSAAAPTSVGAFPFKFGIGG